MRSIKAVLAIALCIYPSLDEVQGEVWKSVADFARFCRETWGINFHVFAEQAAKAGSVGRRKEGRFQVWCIGDVLLKLIKAKQWKT